MRDNAEDQKVTQDPDQPDQYVEVQNPNWQDNIQYFFREKDVECMLGKKNLHLDEYSFVKKHVNQVLNRVKGKDGSRMPEGGPVWADERINTLNNWKKTGKPEAPDARPKASFRLQAGPQVARTRKSLTDASLDMDLVAKAFKGLMDREPAHQNAPPETLSYYDLAAFHGHPWGYCTHHSNSYNPWHRLYNIRFETAMRTVPGCEDVTLPYWDIQESIKDGKIPEILSRPPFDSFSIRKNVVPDLNVTKRNGDVKSIIKSADGYTTTRYSDDEILKKLESYGGIFALVDKARHALAWEKFNGNTTDGVWTSGPIIQAHDQGHDSIGETMRLQSTAAYDPIFWFFHCNWDRLWWEWQKDNQATDLDSFLKKVGDNKDWLSQRPDVGYELDPFEIYCWETIDIGHYKINEEETGVDFAPSSTPPLIAASAPERLERASLHGDLAFSLPETPIVSVTVNRLDRIDIPGTFILNLKSDDKVIRRQTFFQNHQPAKCENCLRKPLVNFVFDVEQEELVGELSFEIYVVATEEVIPLSDAGDPTVDVGLLLKR